MTMKEINTSLNRREFLLKLGAGSAVAIAGFFTCELLTSDDVASVDRPCIADCKRQTTNGLLTITGKNATCVVNKTGEFVIDLLNGKNTLFDICRRVAQRYAVLHTNEMEVSVALFICQLSMTGFLVSPYAVTIYED
jgi:limonene-1,2-epoxide hydrolase